MTNVDLRDWMRARRYSAQGLADVLGVHRTTVQRWRDGTLAIPTMAVLALEALAARPVG